MKTIKTALSLLLALALCLSLCCPALADGEESLSVLDEAALSSLVTTLMDAYYISEENRDNISFAYTYTATGDSWYYNADKWIYSASMYKVPLMMILAEKEANNLLARDSQLKGITLGEAEELILVWSNNDYAHLMLNYLGGDQPARERYKVYSSLDNSYYHSDFVNYSFFTARFMDDVMQTLYNEPERFPNIIDCLKRAMPENFYHLKIDPSIPIAQKYGAYEQYNSNTGIIYTPNPFILTVMSDCLSYDKAELFMADAAKLFMDYTLSLDARLEEIEQQRLAEEEAERLAAEQAEKEWLAKEEAERQRAEQEERERLAAEEAERVRLAEEAAKQQRQKFIFMACAGGAGLVLVLLVILLAARSRRKRRERAHRREYERRGGYTPKH